MIQLPIPNIDYAEMIDELEFSMQACEKKNRLSQSKKELSDLQSSYENLLTSLLPPIADNKNDNVVGTLTGKNLKWLYTQKLQKSKYYKQIRKQAKVCPFCLNMDRPKTLDHVLPKSVYFEYSILPLNLVPMCRDCNSGGKGTSRPDNLDEMTIHPYMDASCFFEDQWVQVRFTTVEDVNTIQYYVEPPVEWSERNKLRAKNFFYGMNLHEIFLDRANHEIANLKASVIAMRNKNMSYEDIHDLLETQITKESSISPNHWKVTLYRSSGKLFMPVAS